MTTDNLYWEKAEKVIATNRAWMQVTGDERQRAMMDLLIALGSTELTPPNTPIPVDPGAAALLGLALLLKRYGGTLDALHQAHNNLHT